jgi:soluble lytic murein transglycosylase-like protein
VPIKLNGFSEDTSFQDVLSSALVDASGSSEKTAALDSVRNYSASENIARAKASLESSKAYVPESKTELMGMINTSLAKAAKKYGIDENLLRSVLKLESGFNPYSISKAGAQGLMQLMPGTADALGVTDPFDVDQNIDGGARYLSDQLTSFGGNTELALAAYNAGPNSVRKYNGIPPYDETQNYVRIVMDYYRQYNESGSR